MEAIEGGLRQTRARIERACERSGRSADSVQLMLVTKTVPVERLLEALGTGHALFGENRVQEAGPKYAHPRLRDVEVHMIGHLQRNKVEQALRWASAVHSVDRVRLVTMLERHVDPASPLDVFVQVNTSGEATKFGVRPEEVFELVECVDRSPHLRLRGLMTIAILGAEPEVARPCFRLLRELRDAVVSRGHGTATELSMGMSQDLEVAVEEGATLVRVGTAVFGHRPTPDSYYWPEKTSGAAD
ncbi:MAG: YggS family pyridoxal phosphate-dependent enzyme [Myxococcota bacterium]